MENEKWVKIDNFDYYISNYGNVKNKDGKLRKLKMDRYGYLTIGLWKNGKAKYFTVHRLVAIHFIENPENKPQVNHIDGNKLNNNINNLEWNTAGENTYHAYKNNLIKHYNRKINQYDLDGNFIKTWDSAKDVEIKTNIHNSAICNCCKNKRKTAGGYIWKYVD